MARLVKQNGDKITLQVEISLKGSLLEIEQSIQDGVNEVGTLATEEALKVFDTNGAPIQLGSVRMTSKGKVKKRYETPYGAVDLERHVYQTSSGGKTYCPLDEKARIITSSTPRFAKIISHKYAKESAKSVAEDLSSNHGRTVSRSFLQNVVEVIGSIAEATEEAWMYATPEQKEPVTTVAISLDGTCVLMRKDGYREAMTGTISLYSRQGERLHTVYIGASPQYGKQKFLERLEKEIYAIKLQYPDAHYIGIADGAKFNWNFLDKHTTYPILDFYHATEYLANAAKAKFPQYYNEVQRKAWLNNACHALKHEAGAANALLNEMREIPTKGLSCDHQERLSSAISYFRNQKSRMDYNHYRQLNMPIGSGVTEAACKTLIKQRLCQSGMKWGEKGARLLLCLRSLVCTPTRFDQFWERINVTGLSGLADIRAA